MQSVRTLLRKNKAAWQQVEENVIVVTSQTRKMHILQGVGKRIWQLLESPIKQQDLINKLQDEYDAPPLLIKQDTEEFINQLLEKSIIELGK